MRLQLINTLDMKGNLMNKLNAMTYQQKMKINERLRMRLLHFLAEETFTSITNISILLEREYSQAYRLCKKMESEGLLKMHQVDQHSNRHITIVGISSAGIQFLRENLYLRNEDLKPFVPSKTRSAESLKHKLKIQKFRAIYNTRMVRQVSPFMSYIRTPNKPYPDFAIHVSAGNKNIFLAELECTQKSKIRYEDLLNRYSKLGEHVIYLFQTEDKLNKIGQVIAKCTPKSWSKENFLLFSLIDRALEAKHKHWQWGDGCYYIHNFLSTVIAINYEDLKDGNLAWKKYDFAPFPFYTDSLWAERFPELCGSLDSKGRIIPNITNHP